MVFFRGSKRNFDIWENEFGLPGWGYDSVLPYFKKYENNRDFPNTSLHGTSGPIEISMSKRKRNRKKREEKRVGWGT